MRTKKFFEKVFIDLCEDNKNTNKNIKGGIVVVFNKKDEVYHLSNFGQKLDDIYYENAILSSGILLEVAKDQLAVNFKILKKKLGEEEFANYINFLMNANGTLTGLIEDALCMADCAEEVEDYDEDELDNEETMVA